MTRIASADRYPIQLGAQRLAELRDAVLRAEADGYDTTWVFDHFDGAMLGGDRDVLECFTLLGALADATTTIGSAPSSRT